MLFLEGTVVSGVQHFRQRMTTFPAVFQRATGENLHPGTVNVKVSAEMPPVEHFRIRGAEIGEPEQDLLFEVCRIDGLWAYRIRPWDLKTGSGGHGDDVLEIACAQRIPNIQNGSPIRIALFRESI